MQLFKLGRRGAQRADTRKWAECPEFAGRPAHAGRGGGVPRNLCCRRLAARLTLEKFCSLDHIVVKVRGSGFSTRIDEVLATLGRKRRARLAVPHFLLAPEIVARSDMISVLPERLVRGYANKLRIFEVPLELEGFTVGQIWHERNQREPAQKWLREMLQDLAQKLPK